MATGRTTRKGAAFLNAVLFVAGALGASAVARAQKGSYEGIYPGGYASNMGSNFRFDFDFYSYGYAGRSALPPEAAAEDPLSVNWAELANRTVDPDDSYHTDYDIDDLVGEWAKVDPESAAYWVEHRPRDSKWGGLAQTLVKEWGRLDSPAAAYWLKHHMRGADRVAAIESFPLMTWTEEHPQAVADWALTMPPGEAQNAAVRRVVNLWSVDDPAGAARWVKDSLRGPLQLTAIDWFLVPEWVAQRPREAVQWALSMPPGPAQEAAFRRVAEEWEGHDPTALEQMTALVKEAEQQAAASSRIDSAQMAEAARPGPAPRRVPEVGIAYAQRN